MWKCLVCRPITNTRRQLLINFVHIKRCFSFLTKLILIQFMVNMILVLKTKSTCRFHFTRSTKWIHLDKLIFKSITNICRKLLTLLISYSLSILVKTIEVRFIPFAKCFILLFELRSWVMQWLIWHISYWFNLILSACIYLLDII